MNDLPSHPEKAAAAPHTHDPVVGGDSVDINFKETAGVIVLGIISLVLLMALLRSEGRMRKLQNQLLADQA